MAKIIINGTIVRNPVGGLVQWWLAWIVGLKQLGHEVFFIEKSEWEDDCYDLSQRIMTSDSKYGVNYISVLFKKYGLENNWCFIDNAHQYHGMNKHQLNKLFSTSDLFLDLEWSDWEQGSENVPVRVFVDGEPGWFQFKLTNMVNSGIELPKYDHYFTAGLNIGNGNCQIPLAGLDWKPTVSPVLIDDYFSSPVNINSNAAFTTVMHWQSHQSVEFGGRSYGQKDIEFEKYISLPSLVNQKMELAVSGPKVPWQLLQDNKWAVKNADDITITVESYRDYISKSRGEFCIAKNAFVETQCGWFGERAGYYMQSGRPVICQETGFSKHIPCGEGLFAINNVTEAAIAIETINSNYEKHSAWSREIVHEYFDAQKVLKKLLSQTGI